MEDGHDYGRASLVHGRSNSICNKDEASRGHHRRKSSVLINEKASTPGFSAEIVYPPQDRPQWTFSSVATILRAHLPLSWLSATSSGSIRPGTILRANIDFVTKWEYHILVARLLPGTSLFALERIESDNYVCHPLQAWVTLQWVRDAAIGAAPPTELAMIIDPQRNSSNHSRHSSMADGVAHNEVCVSGSPKVPKNRRGHLARLSILEPKQVISEPSVPIQISDTGLGQVEDYFGPLGDMTPTTVPELGDAPLSANKPCLPSKSSFASVTNDQTIPGVEENIVPEKPLDHLSTDHLRSQYLETLYLAKTSLAFYAKGPLSRARARARVSSASRSLSELASFYRDSILPTKKVELKYKESIRNKIATFTTQFDDISHIEPKKPRKTTKQKLRKDGLWHIEDEYIRRWWTSHLGSCHASQTSHGQIESMNKAILHLRARETEMQIILLFEVLALETQDNRANDTQVAVDPSISCNRASDKSQSTSISKKPQDLQLELDCLVDRLCIWHSIQFGETSEATSEPISCDTLSQKFKDRLRDFCKDVLVPFYGGKLPELCHSVCTKMGGAPISPQRLSSTHEKEIGHRVPGSLVQQRASKKRNLERVLSEEQTLRSLSPPILSRSATLPTPVTVKTEALDRPGSRSRLHKSVSFCNREVDLVADAKATAAKRQRLDVVAAQKRELNAAIETLKRPNRSAMAKSFMDDAERRAKDRKLFTGTADPIQITATPKRGAAKRSQDDDYDLPSAPSPVLVRETTTVLSSTAKPRGLDAIKNRSLSSDKKKAVLAAIHSTPLPRTVSQQGPVLMTDGAEDDPDQMIPTTDALTVLASTSANSRLSEVFGEETIASPLRMKRSLKPVLFTPIKRSEISIEQAFRDAPEIPARAGKMMDRVMGSKTDAPVQASLYDALGWNDDYDL